ncbi:hypothetical protein G7054_g14841 [Neopestalotiopsis clavispora]|nr:hypothetical protein G7054_g14841 [Neopestalotiopsis clavispora]
MSTTERLQCMEKVVKHYFAGKSLNDQELRQLAASIPDGGAQDLSNQNDAPRLDRILARPSGLQESRTEHLGLQKTDCYEDLSISAMVRTIRSAVDESPNEDLSEVNHDKPPAPEPVPSLDEEPQSDALNAAFECLPPQPIARFLLGVFFRYVQTSIYYVEETWLYETIDCYYSKTLPKTASTCSTVCILLMVMACGTQFAHMESSRHPGDTSQRPPQPTHLSEDNIGQTFHRAARMLLPYIIVSPSFESAQALLMMATYNFSLDSRGTSYAYLSHALSLAVQQGMHDQKYYDAEPDKTLAEVKKRVWWTIYILQMQLSIKYGRPNFLDPAVVTARVPVDVPELHPLKEISSFGNQLGLINLTLITQNISRETAMLRKSNDPIHFSKLLAIRQQLIKRQETFKWGVTPIKDMDMRCLRNHIHLRLYYWNTRLSLGQPFMLSASSFTTPPNCDPETGQLIGRAGLVQDSVDSALEIINLCQILRDHVGFARASYVTEFMSCFTAVLVLLAQTLAKPNVSIRAALSRGLELIRTMSIGCQLARSEVKIIETLERAVIRLQTVQRQMASADVPDQAAAGDATDYDAFKTWTRLWKSSSGLTPPEQARTPPVTNMFENAQGLQQSVGESPNGDMFYGLLPVELSQFDVIPFSDAVLDFHDTDFNMS